LGFLSPLFLWALPLASIPIILHFLNRRNIRVIDFSTIRFLKKLEHESIRKLKILQILLLIIRTLMILFIILMISRPVVSGIFNWVDDPDSTLSVIMIDDSFSNNGMGDIYNRKEINTSALQQILTTIHPDATVLLVLGSKGEIFRGQRKKIPIGMDDVSISNESSDIMSRLQDTINSIDDTYANRELFILTDGQSANFINDSTTPELFKNWNIYIHKLENLKSNLSITDVQLLTEIPITNVPIEIAVSVINNGIEAVNNALMQMMIGDINVGQQVISLEPGRSQEFIFKTAFHQIGRVRGVIDLQTDNRIEDNKHFFYVDLPDQSSLHLIGDNFDDLIFTSNALSAINKDSLLLEINTLTKSGLGAMDLRSSHILVLLVPNRKYRLS